jgi:hypothetical protein
VRRAQAQVRCKNFAMSILLTIFISTLPALACPKLAGNYTCSNPDRQIPLVISQKKQSGKDLYQVQFRGEPFLGDQPQRFSAPARWKDELGETNESSCTTTVLKKANHLVRPDQPTHYVISRYTKTARGLDFKMVYDRIDQQIDVVAYTCKKK